MSEIVCTCRLEPCDGNDRQAVLVIDKTGVGYRIDFGPCHAPGPEVWEALEDSARGYHVQDRHGDTWERCASVFCAPKRRLLDAQRQSEQTAG